MLHLVEHCNILPRAACDMSQPRCLSLCNSFKLSLMGSCRKGSSRTRQQISLTRIVSHLWAGHLHVLQSHGDSDSTTSFNCLPHRSISGMVTRKSVTHYYNVLGLNPNATQGQIKAAYYELSKLHHPDVTECSKSHSLFTEINEAYEILCNLRKRRMYDRGVFNPRDTRGDTVVDEEAKDYTKAYRTGSNFERGSRPPPPTGRSTIYNFDEFYRQHYNEMRERRSTEYKEYVKYKQMAELKSETQDSEFRIPVILVLCSFFITAGVMLLLDNNYDRDHILRVQKKSD